MQSQFKSADEPFKIENLERISNYYHYSIVVGGP